MNIKWDLVKEKLVQYQSKIINQEELTEWLDGNIDVVKYMCIADKYKIVRDFDTDFNKMTADFNEDLTRLDYTALHITYDINILFNVIFKYTNIEIKSNDMTCINYDIVKETKFDKYIADKCNEDIYETIQRCDRMIGINQLNLVYTIIECFRKPLGVEDAEQIKEILNSIDTDKLQIIENIQNFNNPTLSYLAKGVLSKANKEK